MAKPPVAPGFSHEKIETNNFLMIVLILLVVAVGGLVEIVPLFFQRSTTQPVAGLKRARVIRQVIIEQLNIARLEIHVERELFGKIAVEIQRFLLRPG